MAGGLREYANNEGFYVQMHNASSGDLLWGGSKSLKSRKRKASREFYPVERLVSKKRVRNTTEYLVKWKGYSAFQNTWEEEDNLTADLIRSYNKPCIPPERLCRNLDFLQVALTTKLKSKNRNKLILDFEHDVFRYLFYGKGRQSRDNKIIHIAATGRDGVMGSTEYTGHTLI
ncbi:chromobox protein homolog 5-like [Dendronephthya gigantea]|uniref:chromobox protein homolog 5-like n=1 Tax=Dendronephthya gigantea TaxID=151771 RepID=UPI00106D3BC4|nr:chromobox protein homolog 5-like [Dendronephthya gigantea]